MNAQGEDVVAGIRTPIHLAELAQKNRAVYEQLCAVRSILEIAYKDMQDLEFTVQEGKLYMLQCRTGKRTPRAAFQIAVEQATQPLLTSAEAKAFVKKGYLPERYAKLAVRPIITKEDAVARITDKDIEGLFYPIIDPAKVKGAALLAAGIDAVPGAAAGKVVFTAHEAEAMAAKGEKVVLVRKETSPEDVGGMFVAQGILTATGGKTSHAAVVARGWGKCCIVGCEKLAIDYNCKSMEVDGRVVKQGDWITLNGTTGEVFLGELPLIKPQPPTEYKTLMSWADQIRRLKVRTNADTPRDAKVARGLGAEGIGLCRTEHMFFKDFEVPADSEKRQLAIQEMIVAEKPEDRKKALAKLLPFQRRDFIGIFEAMDGLPVTIRLIDPPLHEFTPKSKEEVKRLAQATGHTPERIEQRSEQLHEANPMLGHRGCRLCITYPEILDMQVRAIIEAACDCKKRGIKVIPEIMHPVVMDAKELRILEQHTRRVADEVMKEQGVKVEYLVGTMIELPRAALLADKVAEVAEFFSFGTNDLTQTVCGLSRDDAGRFLPDYVDEKKAAIFKDDPFQSLDPEGVGMLVEWGTQKGREGRARYAKAHGLPKAKAWLKVGICGEHGGEIKSVKFCHRVGMDYVSCSPFRVPIARLAAAQAVIEEKKAKTAAPKAARRRLAKAAS
jgi:pyruvate,orthophosphate dikinase